MNILQYLLSFIQISNNISLYLNNLLQQKERIPSYVFNNAAEISLIYKRKREKEEIMKQVLTIYFTFIILHISN